MEGIIKASGIVMITVSLYIILNAMEVKNPGIYCIAGGMLLVFLCVPKLKEIINTVNIAIDGTGSAEYMQYVLKSIFIVFISDIICGIAKDSAKPYLADCFNCFTRIEIIVISLPVFKALLDAALSFI